MSSSACSLLSALLGILEGKHVFMARTTDTWCDVWYFQHLLVKLFIKYEALVEKRISIGG